MHCGNRYYTPTPPSPLCCNCTGRSILLISRDTIDGASVVVVLVFPNIISWDSGGSDRIWSEYIYQIFTPTPVEPIAPPTEGRYCPCSGPGILLFAWRVLVLIFCVIDRVINSGSNIIRPLLFAAAVKWCCRWMAGNQDLVIIMIRDVAGGSVLLLFWTAASR